MGWLGSIVSSVSNAVSSTFRAVKQAVSKAVNWLADEAETFVGEVKRLYQAAKPYISSMRIGLLTVAKHAPWPWLKAVSMGLERALAVLEHLDSHPFAAKVQEAIEWVIARAREWKEKVLNEQEIAKARKYERDLRAAMEKTEGADRQKFQAVEMINRYLLVKAMTHRLIETEAFVDFQHYLRVRAVQKLLQTYDEQMRQLQDVAQVGKEPLFIIDVATQLIEARAELSDADVQRLDEVTMKHFGKAVIPFVFEEMIVAWGLDYQNSQAVWDELNKQVAKDRVLKRRLELEAELEPLEPPESKLLDDLRKLLPRDEAKLEALGDETRAKRNYVFAAEGFLQLLEKSEEQIMADDQEYLIERGETVGEILVRCAQNGQKWESLSVEEQSLIVSFANIFEEDCRKRTDAFKLIEVAA